MLPAITRQALKEPWAVFFKPIIPGLLAEGHVRYRHPRLPKRHHNPVGTPRYLQLMSTFQSKRPRTGLCHAILGTLRIKEDGLLSLGPPCSSFVFINSATSGRTRRQPLGYEHRPYVEMASMSLACDIYFIFIHASSTVLYELQLPLLHMHGLQYSLHIPGFAVGQYG